MTAKRHQDAQGSNENYTVAVHATTLFVYIWKQRIPPNLDDVRCFICVFGCVYFFFTRLQIYDLQFFTKL